MWYISSTVPLFVKYALFKKRTYDKDLTECYIYGTFICSLENFQLHSLQMQTVFKKYLLSRFESTSIYRVDLETS